MDISYLLLLQQFREATGNVLTPLMELASDFVVGAGYYIIMALLYWCVDKRVGTWLIANTTGGNLLNQAVKNTFCVYRPWIRDSRIIPAGDSIRTATGYSFPSGHTQLATSLFGTLGLWQRKRKWLTVFFALCLALVGFSRNYLGVHTPQDVMVSFLLCACVVLINQRLIPWLEGKSGWDTKILAAGLALCIASLAYITLKPYPMDYVDGVLLVDPAAMMADCYKAVGISLGFLVGWFLERRTVCFVVDGAFACRVARGLIGLVLLFLVYRYAMSWLAELSGALWGELFGWLILSFYITAGYPFLFSRAEKLVEKHNSAKN